LEEAYKYASGRCAPVAEVKKIGESKLLTSGAEALTLGSVVAGVKFYAAWP
jgi:2-oxoglutarate ferredoxin oxidoreductase subunit alpha